jgi:exodeoxyribonuclease VII large subunit
MQPTPDHLSVSELNQRVKTLLESGLGTVWVEGELSNVARPPSGHIYFTLKDAKAQVRCAMFKGSLRGNQPWKDGMQVLVRARVSIYAPRGDYQLIVDQMQEAGLGALQQAFEALKVKLEKEGLFDQAHKKPMPEMPTCLGVITSPTGAAIHDILHAIERRYPALRVIVYPTLVQGAQAAESIARMITLAQVHNQCDVLIVGRGGGSLEDLWPFNEEVVARALYQCKIPVISAVGHETDVTISDFVADLRAPTPTAAAELITPDGEGLLNYILDQQRRLVREILSRINQETDRLQHLTKRLTHPGQQLNFYAQTLDELWLRMQRAMQHQLTHTEHQFLALTRALEALSPLAILNRGYSITFDAKGKALHSVQKLKAGDTVETRLADGVFESVVSHFTL